MKNSKKQSAADKRDAKDASSKGPKKEKRAPVSVTCSAKKRNGKPCGLPPIKGGTVCHKHGGSAPQVRAKANERLREMVLPALRELRKIIDSPTTSDADKLKAINMVLQRTGYNEHHSIDIGLREPTPFDNLQIAAFRIARGEANVLDSDDDSPTQLNGDDPEHYAIEAQRNANREALDRESRIDNDDADLVVGRVVRNRQPGPDDFDPLHDNTRKRRDYQRHSEYSGGPGDDQDGWAAYERRIRESQEP